MFWVPRISLRFHLTCDSHKHTFQVTSSSPSRFLRKASEVCAKFQREAPCLWEHGRQLSFEDTARPSIRVCRGIYLPAYVTLVLSAGRH